VNAVTALRQSLKAILPDGWRMAKLGEICRIVGGSTPSSHAPQLWGGDIIWITPTDLGNLKGEFIESSERKITKAGYESCGTEIVPVGSVVLSSRAPIGHLGVHLVPLCTNQGCKTFIPGAEVDSQFLYYALKLSVPALQALGSGATFAEVSKSDLEAFAFPLPPLADQKRIAGILKAQMAAVERARHSAEAQLQAAEALPAALLRRAFSGEL
jgi:type I restriction enzyme S subunit